MRHIIQAPLKGFLGFLGTLFFGTIFELCQGEDYNYDPNAVSIYNAYASKTSLTISVIKNFGLTAALVILWWTLALLFPPLCVKVIVIVFSIVHIRVDRSGENFPKSAFTKGKNSKKLTQQ